MVEQSDFVVVFDIREGQFVPNETLFFDPDDWGNEDEVAQVVRREAVKKARKYTDERYQVMVVRPTFVFDATEPTNPVPVAIREITPGGEILPGDLVNGNS